MKNIRNIIKTIMPNWLVKILIRLRRVKPINREVENLLRLFPISKQMGFDRGKPIDRIYIEDIIKKNIHLIKGDVLEVAEPKYSRYQDSRFINKIDILHYSGNKLSTIVGDLSKVETLPSSKYDCFICTQVINFIYNYEKAIQSIYYLLKQGGSAIVTVPGISQLSPGDRNEEWGEYWRFTTFSIKEGFSRVFGEENIKVGSYGNVASSVAFLHGLAAHELTNEELMFNDDNYQLNIHCIATKK